jgi:DNA-binding NarL/FixJ family response regulator
VLLLTADSPTVRQELLAVGADGLVPHDEDFDALAATLGLHLR